MKAPRRARRKRAFYPLKRWVGHRFLNALFVIVGVEVFQVLAYGHVEPLLLGLLYTALTAFWGTTFYNRWARKRIRAHHARVLELEVELFPEWHPGRQRVQPRSTDDPVLRAALEAQRHLAEQLLDQLTRSGHLTRDLAREQRESRNALDRAEAKLLAWEQARAQLNKPVLVPTACPVCGGTIVHASAFRWECPDGCWWFEHKPKGWDTVDWGGPPPGRANPFPGDPRLREEPGSYGLRKLLEEHGLFPPRKPAEDNNDEDDFWYLHR